MSTVKIKPIEDFEPHILSPLERVPIEQINLYKDEVPEEAMNVPVEKIVSIIKEAITVLNEALNWIEKILIFFGKMDKPTLSRQKKIEVLRHMQKFKGKNKEERKEILRNIIK